MKLQYQIKKDQAKECFDLIKNQPQITQTLQTIFEKETKEIKDMMFSQQNKLFVKCYETLEELILKRDQKKLAFLQKVLRKHQKINQQLAEKTKSNQTIQQNRQPQTLKDKTAIKRIYLQRQLPSLLQIHETVKEHPLQKQQSVKQQYKERKPSMALLKQSKYNNSVKYLTKEEKFFQNRFQNQNPTMEKRLNSIRKKPINKQEQFNEIQTKMSSMRQILDLSTLMSTQEESNPSQTSEMNEFIQSSQYENANEVQQYHSLFGIQRNFF